jgi:hypothetical protein
MEHLQLVVPMHLLICGMEQIKNVYANFISNKINENFFFQIKYFVFRYPAGITSLAFSSEGNMLAIASSYNYEYGADVQLAPNDITKNNIFVRRVSDLETKPK